VGRTYKIRKLDPHQTSGLQPPPPLPLLLSPLALLLLLPLSLSLLIRSLCRRRVGRLVRPLL
jgi:hypothetical protein